MDRIQDTWRQAAVIGSQIYVLWVEQGHLGGSRLLAA